MKSNYHKKNCSGAHRQITPSVTTRLGQVMSALRAEISIVIQSKFSLAKLLLIYIMFLHAS